MRFINIHSCKLMFDMGELTNKINNVSVSPNGRYIIAVNEDGAVGVFSLQTLSAELNKVTVISSSIKNRDKEKQLDLS